ncbi:MAG: MarR family winged helix-turn-helix transcriptional regulator [Actinomycetota bacterium]|nr:MarR family winged helix-turn-helix transcriptional regulator [Actinomycetota bacterium]
MAYPDEDTPLLLLLVVAERHMVNALQEHLVTAGFHDHRAVHHTVMAHVTHDGIRTTELAQRAGVTKQAMSELVRDLVALGYLQTKPDPHDGRAKLITFSERGQRAVDVAMSAFDAMEEALGKRIGPQALLSLRRILVRLLDTSLAPPAVRSGSDSGHGV